MRQRRRLTIAARGLLIAAAVVVVAVTLTPHNDANDDRSMGVVRRAERAAGADSVDADTAERADIVGNVLLFVPLGALLVLAVPGGLVVATAGGAGTSAGVELVQKYRLPARDGSARDVLANTMGAFIGALLVVSGRRFVQARRRR